MKNTFNSAAFALGLVIGIAGLATGESRLVPVMGLTQGAADGLYFNVTGDTVSGNIEVQGDTALDGDTAIGDAAGDTVTGNADRWLWPNASTFLFGGGTFVLDASGGGGMKVIGDCEFADDVFLYGDTIIGQAKADQVFFDLGTVWWLRAQTHHVDGDRTTDASGFQLLYTTDLFRVTGPIFGAGDLTVIGDIVLGNEATDTLGAKGIWDLTGLASLSILDPTAATHAVNRQFGDARYILQSSISLKAGTVAGATFAGNPKIFTVTFNTAFPNTNYAVTIISEESRTWTFQSKLAGSFVMNSNANLALTLNVDWTATAHIDP